MVVVFWGMGLLWSCDDIMEEDITGEKPVVLSPGQQSKINSEKVTFWWEVLNGAEKYCMQVVKPDFENIEMLVVDTLIDVNKFTASFQHGKYEWRLRAENGGYSTVYVYRSFSVDTTGLNLIVAPE
ncbi:hypothetical protein DMA11_20665 [Marinilabiliaceae bacterium JC017]|nr:hypothetical protein DMA11_20665 [Marinilabiliaceae bacterium JC017]